MATTVADLKRETKENSKKKVRVFNPSTEDFTVKYGPKSYTVKSLESDEFPYHLARHIKKHLITFLINKRGLGYAYPEIVAELEKEVEMEI